MWQSVKILNVFKKLENRFLVKSTKTESASFPYKTAISQATVKTNKMVTTTTLFFWKFCFSLRTSYKELTGCTNNQNAHICTFCKLWSFIWRCFFPVSILKSHFVLLQIFSVTVFVLFLTFFIKIEDIFFKKWSQWLELIL